MTGVLVQPWRSKALRRLAVPALAAAAAACVLVGLGVWQLYRLAAKETLIAQINARTTAPAQPIPPPSDWRKLVPEEYQYRHVRVQGSFDDAKRVFVLRPSGVGSAKADGPGYLVMVPLRLAKGAFVIVDRGFIPQAMRDGFDGSNADVARTVSVTGLMRPPEPRNLFTPADDPERGRWFTRDPPAIARHFGLEPAAPFSIDADAEPGGQWPKGGQTLIDIPNDHLSYALTWFGLAATAVGVFVAFALASLRSEASPSGVP